MALQDLRLQNQNTNLRKHTSLSPLVASLVTNMV